MAKTATAINVIEVDSAARVATKDDRPMPGPNSQLAMARSYSIKQCDAIDTPPC